MAKEKKNEAASAPVETQCSGKVIAITATATAFQFELRGKRSQHLVVAVDAASPALIQTVLAAYQTGEKLHATLSGSTAGPMEVIRLRLGGKLKLKKPKAADVPEASPGPLAA